MESEKLLRILDENSPTADVQQGPDLRPPDLSPNLKVNIQCATCKKRFDGNPRTIICVNVPCSHLVHDTVECRSSTCGVCHATNITQLSKHELDKDDQRLIDILSISRNPIPNTFWDKFRFIQRTIRTIPMIGGLLTRMLFDRIGLPLYCSDNHKWINLKYLQKVNNKIVNLIRLHISISNEDKEKLKDNTQKRILICNHTNYHDMLTMASIDAIPFVAAPTINTNMFGRAITRVYPHVMVENEESSAIKAKDRLRYTELDAKGEKKKRISKND